MQCVRCQKAAVIHQPYSGLSLCARHFAADFEVKAKRAIRTRHWLQSGDQIMVALSGGPGSSALLFFVKKLTARRRDITLSAITIDEGIAECPDQARARGIAAALDVSCTTASFAGEFGTTAEALVQEKGEARAGEYCSVLRRSLLERFARGQGINRIALGSSLEDAAESVLTSILSGEVDSLLCWDHIPEGNVSVIRPFLHIPHQEVALYAALNGWTAGTGSRNPACTTLQADVRTLLDAYSLRHPSARYSLVRLRERISGAGSTVQDRVLLCSRCGEPCSDGCMRCKVHDEVTCRAQ